MQVLFDLGTPVPLRRYLSHTVVTVFEKGWSSMRNGDLLDIAELEGFDGLVTTDQSLKYQQDLSKRHIAIVVLTTTNWAIIEKGVKQVADAIDRMKPGAYMEIAF
jgi:hypothetical protein